MLFSLHSPLSPDFRLYAVSRKLPREHGFTPKVSLEKGVERMYDLLTRQDMKKRITEKAHVIKPVTRWTGEKKESGVLEVYAPGTKIDDGYKGRLDM